MGESYQIVAKKDSKQLAEYLSHNGQALLPMIELIEQGQMVVEQFIEVLGRAEGATENATVVKTLLESLAERGVKPDRRRLFVIDGSRALRRAIDAVFGVDNPVQSPTRQGTPLIQPTQPGLLWRSWQLRPSREGGSRYGDGARCCKHKIANVIGHLPQELKEQVKSVMQAAYRLETKEGMAKLKKQADWLAREYPSAAASLREGLEETFTVNRPGLPAALRRCLGNTNIVESPTAGVRLRTGRVTNWRNGQMVLRWAAAAYWDAEKAFHRIMGYRDL